MTESIRREMHFLFRERKILLVLLLSAATMYALLIGDLYGGHTVERIPIAVCDMDGSEESRRLSAMTREADTIRFLSVEDEAAALRMVREKEAAAALLIPQGMAADMAKGNAVRCAFISDGANTLVQSYANAAIAPVIATFSAMYQVELSAAGGSPHLPPAPVGMSLRIRENPTQSYAFFYLYGVMVTASQIGLTVSFACSVQRDARRGTLRGRLLPAFAGRLAVYLPLHMLSVMAGIAVIIGPFEMPFKGELAEFLLLDAAFAFAAAGTASLFALYFRTELALLQALVFYALPSFLLSGYIWPEAGMLPFMRFLSALFPLHYILVDFRDLALTGTSAALPLHAAELLFFGAACFAGVFLWERRKCLAKGF